MTTHASPTTAAAPAFYILGPLEVRDRAGHTMSLPRRKQRALLALLLLHAGTTVRTDEIVDALWGARPPASARANLHSYVSGLRHVLGRAAPAISRRPSSTSVGYRLDLLVDECDASVFETLARGGRRELAAGRHAAAAEQLTQALSLWRGAMLADPGEYEWMLPYSARLEQLRVTALESLIDARLLLDQHVEVVAELAAATAAHPLRERLSGQYMVALHRAGHRAEALAVYDRLRALLSTDLGVEPNRSLRELRRRIHAEQPGGARWRWEEACVPGGQLR